MQRLYGRWLRIYRRYMRKQSPEMPPAVVDAYGRQLFSGALEKVLEQWKASNPGSEGTTPP
jgi:hypothetical protein